MAEGYIDAPHNFLDVEPYVVTSKEQIVQCIITAEKCYLYDACAFRIHANMNHPDYVIEFVKRHHGIIVITRCVLMELASHSGVLNDEYIEYVKRMYEAGLTVLVLYEEDLFEVLGSCFSSNALVNSKLSFAVRTLKRPTGTIERVLKMNDVLRMDVLKGNVSDGSLYERFFREVRCHKETDDDLGEELLAISVHLLANVPEHQMYKYVVMTDDKGAIGLINKAAANIYKHLRMWAFSALSTARLAQRLYDEQVISEQTEVEEVLVAACGGERICVLGSEEYDLEPKEKRMSCGELAEKIVTPNAIHINY